MADKHDDRPHLEVWVRARKNEQQGIFPTPISDNLIKQPGATMNSANPQKWTAENILSLSRNYQGAAVLAAAAELNLFSALAGEPSSASQIATNLGGDLRGLVILLDALTSLRLLKKQADRYCLEDGIESLLTPNGDHTVLAMVQHHANCLRRWAQLATVVKTGRPASHIPSVLGEDGDQKAFIGAMHNISAPIADTVIQAIQPLEFQHLLDIGGASGTWTMAFLRACPSAKATLFDLPEVIPLARKRLAAAGLLERVQLVEGSFYENELPAGCDLAWVSAIVHQNSRQQNRELLAKVFKALQPGGRIAIRDIIMESERTRPEAGALFAVNMLVATEGGGTFTFAELNEDLVTAGFEAPSIVRRDDGMHSIVVARRS
jgi:precorrin-6B methylase 2